MLTLVRKFLASILLVLPCALPIVSSAAATDIEALPSYNASIGESSISGISSGGFMAVQFGTAWSSVIKGVGVIAGGPYYCAQANDLDFLSGGFLLTATMASCMQGSWLDLHAFIQKADAKAASGAIDPTSNLSRQKVYLFHGYNDAVIAKPVANAAADFYRHYLGTAGRGNLYYQTALGAGHSLVVLNASDADGLADCPANASPFIDQCGYDQAGIILQHIYGALNPPNRGSLTGKLKSFKQSSYSKPDDINDLSMDETGFVFVPKDCETGEACRVHVALHGCLQDEGHIGRRFVDHTGYNPWADTNRIIVLYPQTKASLFAPTNPEACWDWWSYVDHTDNYVSQSGAQIRTIKAMLDALTAGVKPPSPPAPPLPGIAPSALSVTDTSDTGAALAWTPVAGAETYRVWRAGPGGAFVLAGVVAGPSFGDSSLKPNSSYHWRVAAVVSGREGPTSETTATTRPAPAPCFLPGTCPIPARS